MDARRHGTPAVPYRNFEGCGGECDPPRSGCDTAPMGSFPTRKQHRLSGYDYTTVGFYFVTLCVQGRLPLLGRIVSDDMRLSPAGEIAQDRCEEIPRRYSGIELDTVMVMPDHLHAIISLGGDTDSLSTVVHWLKSRTTSDYTLGVRAAGWPPFHGRLWQPGFYDRVMRDDQELNAIREYVMQNPLRWSLREQGV
jgi:putative transposase